MENLKRNNLGIGLLTILVASVFAPTLVYAKDYTVGVKAGDWVKYGQITATWTGTEGEPAIVYFTKNIDWERIDFLSVGDTTADLNLTEHYNNGTQTFQSFPVYVGNPYGMLYLVASNLTAGDPFDPTTPESTINQTVTRLYAGANRNVNIVDSKRNGTGYSIEFKEYWDQNTGVMVELYNKDTDLTNSSAYFEVSFKATETNLWSSNAFDLIQNNLIYIVAGIAVIIVVMAATIVLRKRRPPSSQQPPPPSTPPPARAFPIQDHA